MWIKVREVGKGIAEWILVTEKLPKQFEEVLVTVAGDKEEDDWVQESYLTSMSYTIWENDPTLKVIAWRPLPEPYKREEGENDKEDTTSLEVELKCLKSNTRLLEKDIERLWFNSNWIIEKLREKGIVTLKDIAGKE